MGIVQARPNIDRLPRGGLNQERSKSWKDEWLLHRCRLFLRGQLLPRLRRTDAVGHSVVDGAAILRPAYRDVGADLDEIRQAAKRDFP